MHTVPMIYFAKRFPRHTSVTHFHTLLLFFLLWLLSVIHTCPVSVYPTDRNDDDGGTKYRGEVSTPDHKHERAENNRFCWLLLLLITVSLLLWYNHITKTGEEIALGLRGYMRILPGIRSRSQYLALRCAHCAMVSSSGQVLGSRRGHEIDGHECVIRMNAAPTHGFEADVGNKTTVRVVAHSSVRRLLHREAFFFSQEANTRYVVWGPERNMRHDGKGRVFNMLVKLARKYAGTHIYAMTREKMMQCDRVFQNETGKNRMKSGAFLSTGFFTMIFALDVCDSINVYGMIDGSYCSLTNSSSVPYHYYESSRLDECGMYKVHERARRGGHRFITEKQIYRRWASQGKIKFQHPTW